MAKFLQKNVFDDGVDFVLGNGKKLSAKIDGLSPEMVKQLALHGLSQKVGDSAANCAKLDEFTRALEQMTATWENLLQDKWRADGGSGSSVLIAALIEHTGKSEAVIREAVGKADEEKLKQWRGNASIKAIMARIAAEKAAAKAADTEDDDIEL